MKFIFSVVVLVAPFVANAGGAIVSGGFNDRAIQFIIGDKTTSTEESAELRLFAFISNERSIGSIRKLVGNFEKGVSYCLEYGNAEQMDLAVSRANRWIKNLDGISGQSAPECP